MQRCPRQSLAYRLTWGPEGSSRHADELLRTEKRGGWLAAETQSLQYSPTQTIRSQRCELLRGAEGGRGGEEEGGGGEREKRKGKIARTRNDDS